jgi:hypothetical protein
MNTTDKVIVRFKSRVPKMLYTGHYNGMLLASGRDPVDLGEFYACKYCTEWILQDGNNFYTQRGVNI